MWVLFGQLIVFESSAQSPLGQTNIWVTENFGFSSSFNITHGYSEKPISHLIIVQAENLSPTTFHNLTVVLKTNATVLSFWDNQQSNIKNQTDGKTYTLTALFEGERDQLYIALKGDEEHCIDPLDIMILPNDLTLLPLDEDGHLRIGMWLNSSQLMNLSWIRVYPVGNDPIEIRNMKVETTLNKQFTYGGYTSFTNITAGNHYLNCDILFNGLSGEFQVEFGGYLTMNTSLPVDVYLDGQSINYQSFVSLGYQTDTFRFIKAEVPGIYGYLRSSTYGINYFSPNKLVLTIDLSERERLDWLTLTGQITDFSVRETYCYGNPVFTFEMILDSPSNASMGLTLNEKSWFLRPSQIKYEDIPADVAKKYTDPSSSIDGEYIDKDNPIVALWSRQVIGNSSNPFLIAYQLFENLTKTLRYDDKFENFTSAESELASYTLHNGGGTCRHFSRAYAALLMSCQIPVRTVVGTSYSENNTYKKNHEWNEVYFPGYGWVSVDVTWKKFATLPSSHIQYSYWQYIEGSLNIERSEKNPKQTEESKIILDKLINICENKLSDAESLVTHLPIKSSGSLEQASVYLDLAKTMRINGDIHESLINIAKALSLIEQSYQEAVEIIIAVVMAVALIFVIIFWRFTKMKHAKQ
jgi:hypothetical protein